LVGIFNVGIEGSLIMANTIIKCRKISRGQVQGKVIISKDPLSFLGGVDPKTGNIIDSEHDLYNKNVSGKILVIPSGKGSTVGSYVIFQMAKKNTAPLAIIVREAEPIIATGSIMAGIPMVDQPEEDILQILKEGDVVEVNADLGTIKIIKN
jgi:phosphomecalonate degydratase small subunit